MADEVQQVSAVVRSQVVRAKMEVEVRGSVEQIASVFDSVLSSVAKHFPNMSMEDISDNANVVFGGESQDVEPETSQNQPIGKLRRRTGATKKL